MNISWRGLFVGAVLGYLGLPFVAGYFEIGNKMGPKLYPSSYHAVAYSIAYSCASKHLSEGSNKPRIGWWFRSEHRPLFYGLHDRNEDYTCREELKAQKRREAQIGS